MFAFEKERVLNFVSSEKQPNLKPGILNQLVQPWEGLEGFRKWSPLPFKEIAGQTAHEDTA